MPDQVFGLLLQQCVEKAVKSLILVKNLQYYHTHDIRHLLDTLAKKLVIPDHLREMEDLTIFASKERYETSIFDDLLDRHRFLDAVAEFLSWASEVGSFDGASTK